MQHKLSEEMRYKLLEDLIFRNVQHKSEDYGSGRGIIAPSWLYHMTINRKPVNTFQIRSLRPIVSSKLYDEVYFNKRPGEIE